MALSRSMGSRYDGAIGVNPIDTRLDLAAMLAHAAAGSAAVRVGVFPGCNPNLVTGTTGWNYQIDVADFATSRGAIDGAHIFGNGAVALAATDQAPGTAGSSRWDVIYVLHPSKGENSDTSSTPIFAVARGLPSVGTPAVPTIPTGALELARNLMTSSATSTASAGNTLSQTWRYTALRGVPIVVRNATERDELNTLATANNPVTADRLDTGTLERNAGSGWVTLGTISAWQAYTPALSGVNVGTGSVSAQWRREADLIRVIASLVIGGTASMAQPRLSLPVTAAAAAHPFQVIGVGSTNPSNQVWPLYVTLATTTQAQLNYQTSGQLLDLSLTAPATYQVGNVLAAEFAYRPA